MQSRGAFSVRVLSRALRGASTKTWIAGCATPIFCASISRRSSAAHSNMSDKVGSVPRSNVQTGDILARRGMLPAFFSVKGRAKERYKMMSTEKIEIPLQGEDGSKGVASQLHDEKYVVFTSVKPESAVELSNKMRNSRLEPGDYKNIYKATTEERSGWNSLMAKIKLEDPNVPEKILPYSHCNWLLSKNLETSCPKLYDLLINTNGSIVVADCTKQLLEELYGNNKML